jgi:hypothetical protein
VEEGSRRHISCRTRNQLSCSTLPMQSHLMDPLLLGANPGLSLSFLTLLSLLSLPPGPPPPNLTPTPHHAAAPLTRLPEQVEVSTGVATRVVGALPAGLQL